MVKAYSEAGMKPVDILRALTTSAAEMLGWGDRIGSISCERSHVDLVVREVLEQGRGRSVANF